MLDSGSNVIGVNVWNSFLYDAEDRKDVESAPELTIFGMVV